MQDKVKTDYKIKGIIILVYVLLILLVHIPMTYISDDSVIAPTVSNESLWENFMGHFYSNGRIFTDVAANLFYRMPMWIWKVFDVLVYLCILMLIVYLFTDCTWKDVMVTGILILLFPFNYLTSAGYVATSTNYVYPVLCILITLVPIYQLKHDQKVKMGWYIISFLAIIYVSNHDQSAMVMIGGLTLYLIYLLFHKNRNGKDRYNKSFIRYIVVCWIYTLVCYVLMFIMPGHQNRMNSTAEMEYWLPQYADWSFLKKAYHGYSSTISNILFNKVDLFIIFCVLLFWLSILCKTENLQKYRLQLVCGSIPVVILLITRLVGRNSFIVVYDYAVGMPELLAFSKNPLPLFCSIIVIVCIFANMGLLLEGEKRYLGMLLLLLAAGSRWMMGFSATIYASSFRTFTIFIYVLIICNLILYKKIKEILNKSINELPNLFNKSN